MILIRRCRVLLAIASLAISTAAQSAKPGSLLEMAEFVRDWQISKQFTLDVANAMPGDLYNFKPNREEMTFGEQMIHIADSNVYRFNEITGIKPPYTLDPDKPAPSDKETTLKRLEQSFDYVIDVLPKITPEQLQHTWHIPSWKGRPTRTGAR